MRSKEKEARVVAEDAKGDDNTSIFPQMHLIALPWNTKESGFTYYARASSPLKSITERIIPYRNKKHI